MTTNQPKTVKELLAIEYPKQFTFVENHDDTIITATYDEEIGRYVLTYITEKGEERTVKGYSTAEVKIMVGRGTFLQSLI